MNTEYPLALQSLADKVLSEYEPRGTFTFPDGTQEPTYINVGEMLCRMVELYDNINNNSMGKNDKLYGYLRHFSMMEQNNNSMNTFTDTYGNCPQCGQQPSKVLHPSCGDPNNDGCPWGLPKTLGKTYTLPAENTEELHPTSAKLLTDFFQALSDKMIANQKKYGWQDEWAKEDWEEECREHMMLHIGKGDPKDVAIYAAFMWARGWSTVAPVPFEEVPINKPSTQQMPYDHWLHVGEMNNKIYQLEREVERLKGENEELLSRLKRAKDNGFIY